MSISPGDVLVARVPYITGIPEGYTNTVPVKERPVLVISAVEFNAKESAVIVVPLSSRTDRIDNYDVHITTKQGVKCGLCKKSVARPSLLTALSYERLVDRLGKAPPPLMEEGLRTGEKHFGDKLLSQLQNIPAPSGLFL